MRIDLGRGDISVTQQRLYHPKIGSVVQKMAGEGMAQHVRAQLAESRRGCERLEVAGKMLARQVPAWLKEGKSHFVSRREFADHRSVRYSCMALLAASLSGTRRSLLPLPRTASMRALRWAADIGSATSSET